LVGQGHLENVLAAARRPMRSDAARDDRAGSRDLPGVPGRLEPVVAGQDFTVLVDYAHTPDALAGVLGSLRALVPARLICVFGCGGDRDRGKRPLMGEAVGRHVDLAILTSDNPRTEDPTRILADAEPGLERAGLPLLPNLAKAKRGYLVQSDRTQAIASALMSARPGDCVVIAGKGHEDYQIIGTEKRPFDDRAVARRCSRPRPGVGSHRRGGPLVTTAAATTQRAPRSWELTDAARERRHRPRRGRRETFTRIATDTARSRGRALRGAHGRASRRARLRGGRGRRGAAGLSSRAP
jgi:UDP-N-acetylmuramoyl-L-alanyl-D-glutamate--2,6-diaminopimelate ligase